MTMLVDSGATGHFLDDELNPGLKDRMMNPTLRRVPEDSNNTSEDVTVAETERQRAQIQDRQLQRPSNPFEKGKSSTTAGASRRELEYRHQGRERHPQALVYPQQGLERHRQGQERYNQGPQHHHQRLEHCCKRRYCYHRQEPHILFHPGSHLLLSPGSHLLLRLGSHRMCRNTRPQL